MDFEIGKIMTTHGLKGEVKVFPTTDDPKRFDLLKNKEVFLILKNQTVKYIIQTVRYQKNLVLVKFKDIDDVDVAAKLKSAVIKIPKELAVPLEDGEFYIKDIYGISVTTDTGEELGIISDIIFTGANNVYVVENKQAIEKSKKQILIPHTNQCILDIDLLNQKMLVHIPKGLID